MISEAMTKQKIIIMVLIILVSIFFPYLAPYTALASEILVFALFAMAYDLVLGYTGMLSFGHAAFFGIGAYTTGIILIRVYPSVLLGLLGGGCSEFCRCSHCGIFKHPQERHLLHHGYPGFCSNVPSVRFRPR